MGNQIQKRYHTSAIYKINKNNNPELIDNTINNQITYTSSPVNDLTLRNTIWQIINDQKDYDTMEPFNVGTISPAMSIDDYSKMQDAQHDASGNIIPNPTTVTLPIYTPNPTVRAPDRASSSHFYKGTVTNDVYVNQFKAFCTYSVDKDIEGQSENVVSYSLPIINKDFLHGSWPEISPADEKFDINKTAKYPIPIPNIGIEVPDRLKKIQDIAKNYGIGLTLNGSEAEKNIRYKTADMLLGELNRKAYPQILDKVDIGYQMSKADYDKYLINDNTKLLQTKVGSSTNSNTGCDNFMIHQCAKQLYEQGCIKYDMIYDDEGTPQRQAITWSSVNSMCYDKQNFPFTGASECVCINNPRGHALNLKATSFRDDGYIPYTEKINQGQIINEKPIFCGTSVSNSFDPNDAVATLACSASRDTISDITLPMYNSDGKLLAINPQLVPGNCNYAFAVPLNSGGGGACYRTSTQQNAHTNIVHCDNTISIGDSKIDTVMLEAIHMQNNCGQTPSASGSGITQTADQKTVADTEIAAAIANFDKANAINTLFTNYASQITNAPGKIANYNLLYTTNKKDIESKITNANDIIKASENEPSAKINESISAIKTIQSQIDILLGALKTALNESDINPSNIPSSADIRNSYTTLQAYLKTSLDKAQHAISDSNKDPMGELYAKILAYQTAISSTLEDKITKFNSIKTNVIQINTDYENLNKIYSGTNNYGDADYTSDIIHKITDLFNNVATKEGAKIKPNPAPVPAPVPALVPTSEVNISGETSKTNVAGETNVPGETNVTGETNVPGETNVTGETNVPGETDNPPPIQSETKSYLWLIIGIVLLLIVIIIVVIIVMKRKSNNISLEDSSETIGLTDTNSD